MTSSVVAGSGGFRVNVVNFRCYIFERSSFWMGDWFASDWFASAWSHPSNCLNTPLRRSIQAVGRMRPSTGKPITGKPITHPERRPFKDITTKVDNIDTEPTTTSNNATSHSNNSNNIIFILFYLKTQLCTIFLVKNCRNCVTPLYLTNARWRPRINQITWTKWHCLCLTDQIILSQPEFCLISPLTLRL
jgi:hypothetical protein